MSTVPVRNYDIPELRRLDVAHHLPAQTDYGLQVRNGGSKIITRADGCTIWDGEGKAYLDGMAGLWCVAVGYGRAELAQAAYDQMLELPYYNTFFKTATPPAVLLAAKIAEIAGGDLQHVFFNSSGSEANDTVFRMVRHYWTLKGEPDRKIFISRTNAYHGTTVTGVSLGGMNAMHAQGGVPISGIEHVMQPYVFNEALPGESDDDFAARAAQAIEDRILSVGPANVAAFIGEPIQGAGGVIVPPPGYWPRVEAICRKYSILLVCDEVITGFGRTGHWFGHQYFGIKPDMIPMAKGLSSGYLPISAVAVSSHIVDVLRTGGDFVHGFTYSGHPTACAVALANIAIFEREHLVERTRNDTGPYLAAALQKLAAHPLVGQVRSVGLLGAVEIVSKKGTNQRFGGKEGTAGPMVRDACIERGLMVRGIRDTIVLCPPLVITHAEIDRLVNTIGDALTASEAALRAIG
jgi:putrescine---pyruvate transaminase